MLIRPPQRLPGAPLIHLQRLALLLDNLTLPLPLEPLEPGLVRLRAGLGLERPHIRVRHQLRVSPQCQQQLGRVALQLVGGVGRGVAQPVVEGGERVQRVEADVEGAVDLERGIIKVTRQCKKYQFKKLNINFDFEFFFKFFY